MSTCRVCKGYNGPMFKYSTRHYAHGKCGIEKFGADFLTMIPLHMVKALPYFTLKEHGLLKKAGRMIEGEKATT